MKQLTATFIHHWRLTAMLMVLCALSGYAAARLLPERIEATATLSISIDHHRTGVLTDLEQDRMIGVSEDIIRSADVLEAIRIQSEIPDLDADRLQTRRTNDRWLLTVNGSDRQETHDLAVIWLAAAHAALTISQRAAIETAALQNELDGLTRCIQRSADAAQAAACQMSYDSIFSEIEKYSGAIEQKQMESRGLAPEIKIGAADINAIQVRSLKPARGLLTLTGAGIGLLITILITLAQPMPGNKSDDAEVEV